MKDERFVAQCFGKYPFPTWKQAKAVADKSREAAEPFKCPHCGMFHVGHRLKRKLKPRVDIREAE